jgi:hypothetical protein
MKIIDGLSKPGSMTKNNEDIWGHSDFSVWVFDGATGLTPDQLVAPEGQTDPRWLVEQAHDSLLRNANKIADMQQLYRTVLFDCAKVFSQQTRRQPTAGYELPMAASLVLKSYRGRAICGALSDCSLIIETTTGLASAGGDPVHAELDAYGAEKMAEELAKGHGFEQGLANIMPILRRNRGLANQPDGYSVFAPDPVIADRVVIHSFTPKAGGYALLMSDGFYALVDKYDAYSEESLLAAVKTRGLKDLYDQLREIENTDDSGASYARAKKSDDATAVLVQF